MQKETKVRVVYYTFFFVFIGFITGGIWGMVDNGTLKGTWFENDWFHLGFSVVLAAIGGLFLWMYFKKNNMQNIFKPDELSLKKSEKALSKVGIVALVFTFSLMFIDLFAISILEKISTLGWAGMLFFVLDVVYLGTLLYYTKYPEKLQ